MEHTEELPTMPRGPLTYTGRYPGYEPKQAMEEFFSVSCEHERPSYEERHDFWVSEGDEYSIAVGCFVEPDGTPVIVLTAGARPGSQPGVILSDEVFKGEFFSAMRQSAHSTSSVLPDDEITECGESGALRQLRPSELDGGPPNQMKDLILGAMNHLYPGQWEEFWPDFAASFVSEGEGVVVTYNNEHSKVATIILTELQISNELLEGLTEVNVGLPIGSVFLSSVENSWCAVWNCKLRGNWLDGSQASMQMTLDILNNAPNMTYMARDTLRAKNCGGRPLTIDPEEPASWAFIPFSHV